MRILIVFLIAIFCNVSCYAQLEVSTGYAITRLGSSGAPIHLGFDFNLKNRLFTKAQLGYKKLYYYNDFVGATIRTRTIELHQTLSYQLVNTKGYILQPNLGVNFRFYKNVAKMLPPFNTGTQRAWVFSYRRDRKVVLTSYDGSGGAREDFHKTGNLGFSIQIQNKFKLSENLWLHITPFLEPDHDRLQNIGGCYIGVVFKQLTLSNKKT
jgi:hypothetical protein